MPPKQSKKKEQGLGRPSKWKKRYVEEAYKLCAEHGFTQYQLADFWDIGRKTIEAWMKKYPQLYHAYCMGRDKYDSEEIETSLVKRAKGYDYTETTKEVVLVKVDKDSDKVMLDPQLRITKKVKKHYPGSDVAAFFWLTNREPGRWKHKREIEAVHNTAIQVILEVPEPDPLPPELAEPVKALPEPIDIEPEPPGEVIDV